MNENEHFDNMMSDPLQSIFVVYTLAFVAFVFVAFVVVVVVVVGHRRRF